MRGALRRGCLVGLVLAAAPLARGQTFADVTPGPSGVSASTSDANLPAGAVDKDLSTRWSGNGDGAWLRLDLGGSHLVGRVRVAVFMGTSRQNVFDLQVSPDGSQWETVF